jgi:hypothetical protein
MAETSVRHKRTDYRVEPTPKELERFQAALRKKKPEEDGGRFTWKAPCPRCGWPITVQLERSLHYDENSTKPQAQCICPLPHRRRPPAEMTGCGFDVRVPIDMPE